MSFEKRTYVDGETVITAQNLNDIQDAILEGGGTGGLFKVATQSIRVSWAGASMSASATYTPDRISGYECIGVIGYDLSSYYSKYRLTKCTSSTVQLVTYNNTSGSLSDVAYVTVTLLYAKTGTLVTE